MITDKHACIYKVDTSRIVEFVAFNAIVTECLQYKYSFSVDYLEGSEVVLTVLKPSADCCV